MFILLGSIHHSKLSMYILLINASKYIFILCALLFIQIIYDFNVNSSFSEFIRAFIALYIAVLGIVFMLYFLSYAIVQIEEFTRIISSKYKMTYFTKKTNYFNLSYNFCN